MFTIARLLVLVSFAVDKLRRHHCTLIAVVDIDRDVEVKGNRKRGDAWSLGLAAVHNVNLEIVC
eukprot:COSAG02_NODE_8348_length_2603_cov_1.472843_4_plen_64_part_00